MAWVFYALLTAFCLSSADALSKKALMDTDEYAMAWVREAYALPLLVIVLFFIDIPRLDTVFWLTVLALIPLEITALLLYMKAIRVSPLSLTIPFIATTPLFIVLIAFLTLGELPDLSGIIGIVFIVSGGYVLHIGRTVEGILAPFRAIKDEKGSIYMLIVAFIYSITSTLGKVAITHSSPFFFGVFYPFILTLVLSPIIGMRKGGLKQIFSSPIRFFVIGLLMAFMIIFHFLSLSMTSVAYMISVKRTSLIFSVLYGKLLFDEEGIRERLVGSIMMIIGVVLIVLF